MVVKSLSHKFLEKTKLCPSGCIEWTASKTRAYGSCRLAGKTELAHRFSWKLFKGKIPKNLHVLHKCDNPPCVNPNHLFLGTNTDNMLDRNNKGRQSKGSDQGQAKLTEDQVRDIRKKYIRGKYGAIKLSREYKVSDVTINGIVTRKSWTHIK